MKRTAPFAMATTFDAPTGETCLARRDVSNSPLQALTLAPRKNHRQNSAAHICPYQREPFLKRKRILLRDCSAVEERFLPIKKAYSVFLPVGFGLLRVPFEILICMHDCTPPLSAPQVVSPTKNGGAVRCFPRCHYTSRNIRFHKVYFGLPLPLHHSHHFGIVDAQLAQLLHRRDAVAVPAAAFVDRIA